MSPPSACRPVRRGFTLIELMVSTALMVVIVLAVVSVAAETFKAYDRAVADLSTQSEARAVLDAMENDFQTAVIRPDGRCWMEVVLPGTTSFGAPAGTPIATGDLNPAEHPIIMLFAAPQDRPRWSPLPSTPRTALRGDVCAIAYRIGQRSPFSAPGAQYQQVYGVYRTVIDPERTFADALPIMLDPNPSAPRSPWDYWSTTSTSINGKTYSRVYGDYNQQRYVTAGTPLISTVVSAASNMPWTLDDHNFLASNVVAMNLVFWCTSSLPPPPAVGSVPLADPLRRPSLMLRPVLPVNRNDALDQGAKFDANSGYRAVYSTATSSSSADDAKVHFAAQPPSTQGSSTVLNVTPHPYEEFSGRLRIYSDRIYPDALSAAIPATATRLPYLPYSLRAIEVSVTVLTPEGAKELAMLQALPSAKVGSWGTKVDPTGNDFKRIVVQQGRAYTRYIRLLSNGG